MWSSSGTHTLPVFAENSAAQLPSSVLAADGTIVAVHTPVTTSDYNMGTRANPASSYDLRLKVLEPAGAVWEAGAALTGGITKSVSYYDPDVLVSYNGELWELDPVEVRPRLRPVATPIVLESPEAQIFAEENVSVSEFEAFLQSQDLAVVVSRNVTSRDDLDEQQPFNLRVPGGTETIGMPGTVYELASLQLFEGQMIRGLGGTETPSAGRRVLAQPMTGSFNPPNPGGPLGSVAVAEDGSAAAFVPARRALSWQTTDPLGQPVVRERYWLTFQPGEIRACGSCHGVNGADQAGNPPPENPPEALRELLQFYKEEVAAAESPADFFSENQLAVHPNPFRNLTEIQLALAEAITDGELEVFDASGRRLGQVELGDLAVGSHQVQWTGEIGGDSGFRTVSPGVYFLRLRSWRGGLQQSRSAAIKVTRLD